MSRKFRAVVALVLVFNLSFPPASWASPVTEVFEENEVELEIGRIHSIRSSSKDKYLDWVAVIADLKYYREAARPETKRVDLKTPLAKSVKRIELLFPKSICLDFVRDAYVAQDSKTRVKFFQIKKDFLLEEKANKRYQAFLKFSSLDLKDKRASCEVLRDAVTQ
ncbi:hypothetical protein GW916_15380 [bacterium]|nr:hypothetical protein [bacterium]